MLFYVYLDPGVISEAASNGTSEIKILFEILKGFKVNCGLMTFEDYHQIDEIKDHINNLPSCYERKEIKAILNHLHKSNRFIFNLVPDYSKKQNDIETMSSQAVSQEIDFVLLTTSNQNYYTGKPEYGTLNNYNASIFENSRSVLATNGIIFQTDEFSEFDFLNSHLKKLIKNAKRIEFCDYSLGRNYGDNYDYSLKILFQWLGLELNHPNNCEIIFHLDLPSGRLDEHIKTQIRSFLPHQLNGIKINLNYYQNNNAHISLPHQRYLITDQLSLDIGRGVDFINKATRKNRDTSFSYKNSNDIQTSLSNCSSHLIRTLTV